VDAVRVVLAFDDALAGVHDHDAGAPRLAVVAVGLAVTAAHGRVDRRTGAGAAAGTTTTGRAAARTATASGAAASATATSRATSRGAATSGHARRSAAARGACRPARAAAPITRAARAAAPGRAAAAATVAARRAAATRAGAAAARRAAARRAATATVVRRCDRAAAHEPREHDACRDRSDGRCRPTSLQRAPRTGWRRREKKPRNSAAPSLASTPGITSTRWFNRESSTRL